MLEAGLLDSVMERAAAGELALTGEGGFLPELVRSVLERGLSTELSEHLGYEKGDPAGRGSSNSRNGFTPKTLASGGRTGAAGGLTGPAGGVRAAPGAEGLEPSSPTRRSPRSPIRCSRRSRPGRPARWRRSTRSS